MKSIQELSLHPKTTSFFGDLSKKNFINNEWVIANGDEVGQVINPANEEVIATIPISSPEDVNKAVSAAKKALYSHEWRKMLPADRERLLYKLGDLIEENADHIAEVITLENGKPFAEARKSEVLGAAKTFRYYAGWCSKIEGETFNISIPQPHNKQNFAFTRREPIGVVAAVIPWNTPFSIAAWKLAPALAAGCTVVLKPSGETPLNSLVLAELIAEAGFPAGVVNIILGNGSTTGNALVSHPDIDKVTFTGSTATGKSIGKAAIDSITGISLELGGKSPAIVFEDADLDWASQCVSQGIFRNMGQICVSGSRVYIQEKVYDKVMTDIMHSAQKMKIGHGFEDNVTLGPLVCKSHLDTVIDYIKLGKEEGATLISGGKKIKDKGYFLEPAIFSATDNNLRVLQEEIFGPVLVGVPFKTVDEAIKLANQTNYGLSSTVFTKDVSKSMRMVDELEAGWVWVNSNARSDPHFPLGGFKQSGIGKELGKEGLYAFTKTKAVNIVY
ncbi:aldehyde dehydrogenase [Aquimarina sp. Aq78]|uniref:aldehyde dehydrogenase family protein n=1 Tax=Aquimarina sp. Aq78 TaxID=1191889 RepID=UPI000D0F16D5|nr:aldehyde dehydrogenase family protein [Aquimarina sp. Aq78]